MYLILIIIQYINYVWLNMSFEYSQFKSPLQSMSKWNDTETQMLLEFVKAWKAEHCSDKPIDWT